MPPRRRPTSTQTPEGPWRLTVTREAARSQLGARVTAGRQLLERQIDNPSQLKAAQDDYYNWDEYNTALLERLFADDRAKREYSFWGAVAIGARAFHVEVQEHRSDVAGKLRRLESIIERLELADEPALAIRAVRGDVGGDSKVFVVHGRDNDLKEAVARFVEKLGLDAVILHEQPNVGRTIIEKVEAYGDDVAYAIVLLSPDDVGSLASKVTLAPRPRQNVVFELGYFYGRLGRSRVAAIVTGSVEKPTDTDGVVYIDGSNESWRLLLARELQAAGLHVDLNRAT